MYLHFIRGIAISVFLTVMVVAQPAAPSRGAIIDSGFFLDEKAGITKFVAAVKQLNDEFKPAQAEIDALSTRLLSLTKEISDLQKNPVVDKKVAADKYDQGLQLERDIKFKSEDAKDKYERRGKTILDPVQQAIMKGLQEYAKAKGYTLIFDAAKDTTGFLVALGDQTADVTKDFIAFYNARP